VDKCIEHEVLKNRCNKYNKKPNNTTKA